LTRDVEDLLKTKISSKTEFNITRKRSIKNSEANQVVENIVAKSEIQSQRKGFDSNGAVRADHRIRTSKNLISNHYLDGFHKSDGIDAKINTNSKFIGYGKGQDIQTNTTLPLRTNRHGESKSKPKIKTQTQAQIQLFDPHDISDSEIEENILKDPFKRKLMIWLLPHIKNKKYNKGKLKEVFKSKRIIKQDILNIINDKTVTDLPAEMVKIKNQINRYNDDNYDETETKTDKHNPQLIQQNIKYNRNSNPINQFTKSSKAHMKSLITDISQNAISKKSTWNQKEGSRKRLGMDKKHWESPNADGFNFTGGDLDKDGMYQNGVIRLPLISKFSQMKKKARDQFGNF
jgi:hypothetical protein